MEIFFGKNNFLFFIFLMAVFIATGLLIYIPISIFILLPAVIIFDALFISFIIYNVRRGRLKNIIEKLGYSTPANFINERIYSRISVIPLVLMFFAYNVSRSASKIFFYLGFVIAFLLLFLFFNDLRNKTYKNLYRIIFYILLLLAGLVLNFLGLRW